MDAVTLDGLIGELRPRLVGRHLTRPRLAGQGALSFEVSGEKSDRLWLDVARDTAGLYLVAKDSARRLLGLATDEESGRARQLLLHARKHADGARVRELRRVAGERVVVLAAGDARLVLALQAAPALGLVVGDALLGTMGHGEVPWPLPKDEPQREWDRVDAGAVVAALREARNAGRSPTRAVLAVCPGLSPRLVRLLEETPESFERLRALLRSARPTLVAPGPVGTWHDLDLVGAEAVALLPGLLQGPVAKDLLHPPSWIEAGATFLEARLRGHHFEGLHKQALGEARRELRRLAQLEAHLVRDLAGLPDENELRRDADSLLASAQPLPPGGTEVEVDDAYDPTRKRRLTVDPLRGGPRSADRLYAKARRIERARLQVDARLRDVKAALGPARELEQRALAARDASDLRAGEAGGGEQRGKDVEKGARSGPRHYLTSRGLSVLVGRGARENHHLTFAVARPDDHWLHARDVPGAHVIVRDPEGRAAAADLREAAEVAAFCSEARGEAQVDVHVTRRKNVRPARGSAGRVLMGHSETLRVAPRDPEGRLRRLPVPSSAIAPAARKTQRS